VSQDRRGVLLAQPLDSAQAHIDLSCWLGEVTMPPRGVKSAKRKRQYEHIKESAEKRGRTTKRAKEIAARTVNKQRREAGQTKSSRSKSSRGKSKKR
jgi:hypothetical protein